MGDCTKTNSSCVHRSVLRVCFQVSLFFPQWSFPCLWRMAPCPHLVTSRWLFKNAVGQCQHYILDYVQSGRKTYRLCRSWWSLAESRTTWHSSNVCACHINTVRYTSAWMPTSILNNRAVTFFRRGVCFLQHIYYSTMLPALWISDSNFTRRTFGHSGPSNITTLMHRDGQ